MQKDLDYYNECLNADFFIYKNKLLISDLTNKPNIEELNKSSTLSLEKKYNHFHMCFISPNLEEQKNYAIEIWDTWRSLFQKKFPYEKIEISISDDGEEIILWVYRLSSNEHRNK